MKEEKILTLPTSENDPDSIELPVKRVMNIIEMMDPLTRRRRLNLPYFHLSHKSRKVFFEVLTDNTDGKLLKQAISQGKIFLIDNSKHYEIIKYNKKSE